MDWYALATFVVVEEENKMIEDLYKEKEVKICQERGLDRILQPEEEKELE